MVRLTEEMVAARTRVSDCLSVKKLNCWGTELTDVSILRKMRKVEVLSLSVNNIKTLADFQNCIDLKDLFVRKNNIQDINEVCYLQGLPNLRNLWLGENPCADIEGYRLAVLKALPKLEKLDDKVVTQEELRTAVLKGRVLVHPLSSLNQESECSPQSAPESPEIQYSEDHEVNQGENYSSSDDQRSCDEAVNDDYQETDKRNANYNTQPVQQYPPNNRYNYEEYNERNTPLRHNGDYEDINQRSYAASSPRVPYPTTEYEERRSEYDESHRSVSAQSRQRIFQNVERDDPTQSPGWIKRADRGRHYQRRPITRNSNILSAVLCLVKELDYPSLEVVEMAVRSRIDELEE